MQGLAVMKASGHSTLGKEAGSTRSHCPRTGAGYQAPREINDHDAVAPEGEWPMRRTAFTWVAG